MGEVGSGVRDRYSSAAAAAAATEATAVASASATACCCCCCCCKAEMEDDASTPGSALNLARNPRLPHWVLMI
jgi:hypothetical protein